MPKFPKPYFRSQRGTWCVQIGGKQITLGPDKDEAMKLYHQLMAGRDEPKPTPSSPRVAPILDAFLTWLRKRVEEGSKARRTFDWYSDYLRSFADTVPDLAADQLQPIHVYRWVDSHPGWTTGKRGAMTAVQRAFSWAAKAGLIAKSPLTGLEKPPAGRREQLVSEEEYAEVLSLVKYPEARDLLELSWNTGMRPHELFTAEARFLEDARIVFPVKLSKGRKVQRVVYLNDNALEIVRRNVLKNPSGPLLRNADGEPWNGSAVHCLFQRVRQALGRARIARLGLVPPRIERLTAVERADAARRRQHEATVLARRQQIKDFAKQHGVKYSLYAFRHAFVTEALVNGVDAVTVSILAGHRDTAMISRHYAHCAQRIDHMRDAVNRARGG